MPSEPVRYPKKWRDIRSQALRKAKNVCERCKFPNGKIYSFVTHQYENGTIKTLPKRVVLTVVHLDRDRTNNDPSNLKVLCQTCRKDWFQKK